LRLVSAGIGARAATTAVVAAAVLAGPAKANTTPLGTTVINYTAESAATCDRASFTQPLKPYGDSRWYVLAPSGSFTGASAAGWQFRGDASLAADAARGTSLTLRPGASAISPGMCVDLDYPHFRFANKFVARDPSKGKILVEVVYPQLRSPEWTEVIDFDGKQGQLAGTGSWRLSQDVQLKPDFAGDVWGARYVALRFTALQTGYAGEWRVDDIWIDPRMSR
jgi:hypothetical protein